MTGQLETAWLQFYESMSSTVDVTNFVSCFGSVLCLWIQRGDLADTAEALELKTTPETTRLRRVLASSSTCALLFSELGLRVGYSEYLVLTKEKLNVINANSNPMRKSSTRLK